MKHKLQTLLVAAFGAMLALPASANTATNITFTGQAPVENYTTDAAWSVSTGALADVGTLDQEDVLTFDLDDGQYMTYAATSRTDKAATVEVSGTTFSVAYEPPADLPPGSQASIVLGQWADGATGPTYYGWAGETNATGALVWTQLSSNVVSDPTAAVDVKMVFDYTATPKTVTFKVGETTLGSLNLEDQNRARVEGITFQGSGSISDLAGTYATTMWTFDFKDGDTVVESVQVEDGDAVAEIAAPSKTGHTFDAWQSNGSNYDFSSAVRQDFFVTAKYDPIEYTITWSIDGVDTTETLEYGATPSHADPTKEATAQYSFSFTGWNPAIGPVTGDQTYTAQFSQTLRSYTITWTDHSGTVKTESLDYGETPTAPAAAPAAYAENNMNYTGVWPTPSTVEGPATYAAIYTGAPATATVIWVVDGTQTEETYNIGETPVYPGSTPTKTGTSSEVYTFTGWEPAIGTVTAAGATYTAQFSSIYLDPASLAINYNCYGTVSVSNAPAGATFGWTMYTNDVAFSSLSGPLPISSGKKTESLKFYAATTPVADGWAVVSITNGAEVVTLKAPVVVKDVAAVVDGVEYAKADLDAAGAAALAGGKTLGLYVNGPTITLAEGQTLVSQVLSERNTPTPSVKAPAGTAEKVYTVNTAIDNATKTRTYTLTYDTPTVMYTSTDGQTVEYLDANFKMSKDGTYKLLKDVERGQLSVGNVDAVLDLDGHEFASTLSGSKGAIYVDSLIGSPSLTIRDTAGGGSIVAENCYAIWGNRNATIAIEGGEIVGKADVVYLSNAADTLTITGGTFRMASGSANFMLNMLDSARGTITVTGGSFQGFDPANNSAEGAGTSFLPATGYVSVADDPSSGWYTVYEAVTVTFVNAKGDAPEAQVIGKGKTATAPAAPAAVTGYTFNGWFAPNAESAFDFATPVTADLTLTADWTVNSHTLAINYVVPEGFTAPAAYSQDYDYDTAYSVASPAVTGCTPDVATVTGTMGDEDVSVTVTYTANDVTVIWIVDGAETSETYQYGQIPSYKGETPAKDATAQYTYEFTGWDPAPAALTGDATYTAQFSETLNKYTVAWDAAGGTLSGNYTAGEVDYGTAIVAPTATKDSTDTTDYEFGGWTPEVAATVTADATYTATWTETARKYTLTITYEGPAGFTAPETYTAQVANGAEYSVASPVVEGYTADQPTVAGTMPTEDVSVAVTYTADAATVLSIALDAPTLDATGVSGKAITVAADLGDDEISGEVNLTATPAGTVGEATAGVATATFAADWNQGVEWTIADATANSSVDPLVGKSYLKAETQWFTTDDQVQGSIATTSDAEVLGFGGEVETGVVPEAASAAGEQVRIQMRIEVTAAGSAEAPTNMGDTRGGLTVVDGAYNAFNGTEWVELSGAEPKDGEVDLLIVADMAAQTPTARYYIDGVALYATENEQRVYAIPLKSGSNQLAAVGVSSADALKSAITAEYDVPYVAAKGTTGYTTPADAVAAADKTGTDVLELLADVAGEINLVADQSVKIKLNGFTGPTVGTDVAGLKVESATADGVTTYTTAAETYTVIWVVDGQTVETDEDVAYNATPSYDGTTPAKEDATNTYTFTGWSDSAEGEVIANLPAVTADATYYAQFSATPKATGAVSGGVTILDSEPLAFTSIVVDGSTVTVTFEGGIVVAEDAKTADLPFAVLYKTDLAAENATTSANNAALVTLDAPVEGEYSTGTAVITLPSGVTDSFFLLGFGNGPAEQPAENPVEP